MTPKQTKRRLVPYEMVSPGWEAVYTGAKLDKATDSTDEHGNAIERWSTWAFADEGKDWCNWDEEIRHINEKQKALRSLDDETRQIRAHIGSFVPCDNGFPVTVDELLNAISQGKLLEPSFHSGCWFCAMWWESKGTQPYHVRSMRTIYDILTSYLAGETREALISRFPYAEGFISRTYEWLGPAQKLIELKRLMLQRMLLPFEFFGKIAHATPEGWSNSGHQTHDEVSENCFGENGRGARLDAKISELSGLPEIPRLRYGLYDKLVETISEPNKRELYKTCTHIAYGVYELSDCHHNAFRVIEGQIHGIATGTVAVPSRTRGSERTRLGRLLFGYALGLDKWLMSVPMQFLLLDLGHHNLGFDPKNEILRVYAYLGGEKTPLKEWLAACLWYNLYRNPHGGFDPLIHRWSGGHTELLATAGEVGVSAREWMDSQLKESR